MSQSGNKGQDFPKDVSHVVFVDVDTNMELKMSLSDPFIKHASILQKVVKDAVNPAGSSTPTVRFTDHFPEFLLCVAIFRNTQIEKGLLTADNITTVINIWTLNRLPLEPLIRRLITEILANNGEIIAALKKDPRCAAIKQSIYQTMKEDPTNLKLVKRRLEYNWIRTLEDIALVDPRRYPLHGAKELGSGTFGIVYLTKDQKTKRNVAVKVIKQSSDFNYLSNEINLLILLCGHPNIVKLLDVRRYHATVCKKCEVHAENNHLKCVKCAGQEKKKVWKVYFVFEYKNASLDSVIKKHKKDAMALSEDQFIRPMSYQLFQGLAWMHSNSIVHRDIKPDNLLYDTKKNRIEITDFGASRKLNQDRETKHHYVTVIYRPPELFHLIPGAQKIPHTYVVDSWSAGATLMEMYTLKPLFYVTREELIDWKKKNPTAKHADKEPSHHLVYEKIFLLLTENGKTSKNKIARYLEKNSYIHNSHRNADLVDLLYQLLQIDPKNRITAHKALQHPYFKKVSSELSSSEAGTLDKDDCFGLSCLGRRSL